MENQKNLLDEDESISPLKVSDWVKKTLLTGVGAVFMTEEGVRNALLEMKIPKNVIASAIAQADKTKKEIISLVAKEIRQFLDRMELADIIKKALTGQALEIKATIRLKGAKKQGKKKAARKTAIKKSRTISY